MSDIFLDSINDVATRIANFEKNINLIYAFNGTGKTRLCVAYKDVTKARNKGNHSGVYYNAYSEDLFNWDNDEENDGSDIKLLIQKSTLNQFHPLLDEINLQDKLAPYKPNFDYRFEYHDDLTEGIKCIRFYIRQEEKEEAENNSDVPIKISRGEEQVFIWCFFLSLFEIENWTGDGKQSTHFFIDDPVSSLDDHNIFVTVSSVMNLIEQHYKSRKIVITTHHIGFFSILADWLTRGSKSDRYKKYIDIYKLKILDGAVQLVGPRREVFLYHLELLRILKEAIDRDEIFVYHFSLLRQVLENISSFLGVRNFSHVLREIGFDDEEYRVQLVNTMSHKTVFRYEFIEPVEDNKRSIVEIFNAIQEKYKFILHA